MGWRTNQKKRYLKNNNNTTRTWKYIFWGKGGSDSKELRGTRSGKGKEGLSLLGSGGGLRMNPVRCIFIGVGLNDNNQPGIKEVGGGGIVGCQMGGG